MEIDIAEKKQAIFDSTLELVQEFGFHGCPMSAVAKTANVAAGTIYHYFESKEQLLCDLYENMSEKRIKAMFENDIPDENYKVRFFNLWKNLFIFYQERTNVLKYFQQFVNSPFYLCRYKDDYDKFHQIIFDLMAEGTHKGYLKNIKPEILGLMAHGQIMTTSKIPYFGRIQLSDQDINLIIDNIWEGLKIK